MCNVIIGQVVRSLALPFPMIGIMGRFANSGLTHATAIAGTILVLSLNALLVLETFGVPLPGPPEAG